MDLTRDLGIGYCTPPLLQLAGAETPVYVASSPELRATNGKYFDKCRERAPDAPAQDDQMAARLWEETEKLARFKLP
jgi:hypothetical protein